MVLMIKVVSRADYLPVHNFASFMVVSGSMQHVKNRDLFIEDVYTVGVHVGGYFY
jgi:hypothetical protein